MTETASIEVTQGTRKWHQWRERAKEDLYWFASFVLGYGPLIPMTYRAHYALCLFASRRTGNKVIDDSRVQLIQVGRGWGKTSLVTIAGNLQEICRNPEVALGIANERQDNANAFLAGLKGIIQTNTLFQSLFPEVIPSFKDTEWRADRIITKRERPNPVNPTVLATGAGATVTGVHMNKWTVDDIISKEAAENARAGSFTEIDKTNRWIIQLQPLLSNHATDPMTFVGTPWWLGDCYEFVEETFGGTLSKGDEHIWHLKLPDGTSQTLLLEQKGELAIFRMPAIDIDGRAVFPEGGFSLEELRSIERKDPVFFAAQYLLQPSAGEAASFKEEWLKEYWWDNAYTIRYYNHEGALKFERISDLICITSVDPAISRKHTAARSSVITVGTNGTELFLLEAWTGRVGATELATKVLDAYKRYKSAYIVPEAVGYQEALGDVLEMLAKEANIPGRLPIYEHRTGSDQKKDTRILGLEPYFRKGFMYVNKPTAQDFLREYRGFPHLKLRDQMDALAFQKELWERLATRDAARHSTAIGEMQAKVRAQKKRIHDRYARHRRRAR